MSILNTKILQAKQSHKLIYMVAADMFEPWNLIQVFSAKTGKYIGTIRKGNEINFIKEEMSTDTTEEVNKNQLSFF